MFDKGGIICLLECFEMEGMKEDGDIFFKIMEGYYIHSRPSPIDTSSHLTFS